MPDDARARRQAGDRVARCTKGQVSAPRTNCRACFASARRGSAHDDSWQARAEGERLSPATAIGEVAQAKASALRNAPGQWALNLARTASVDGNVMVELATVMETFAGERGDLPTQFGADLARGGGRPRAPGRPQAEGDRTWPGKCAAARPERLGADDGHRHGRGVAGQQQVPDAVTEEVLRAIGRTAPFGKQHH